MIDDFVLAVHTETHILQRVPKHYIDDFPYFKLATKAQVEEAQSEKTQTKTKSATKEGSK